MLGKTSGNSQQEADLRDMVQIFGNPRDGYLTLKGENISKVEVLSISGQIAFTETASSSGSYFVLPTDGLTNGFYLIRVYNGEYCTTLKVIIP